MQKLKRIKKWDCRQHLPSICSQSTSSRAKTSSCSRASPRSKLLLNLCTSSDCSSRNQRSRTSKVWKRSRAGGATFEAANSVPASGAANTTAKVMRIRSAHFLLLSAIFLMPISAFAVTYVAADDFYASTTPLSHNSTDAQITSQAATAGTADASKLSNATFSAANDSFAKKATHSGYGQDSIFMQFAKRFSTGNELWDGVIRDCYQRPSFSCFQKNVYTYLSDALDSNDVNVTQALKFYKNHVDYAEETEPTEAAAGKEEAVTSSTNINRAKELHDHLLHNEIPHTGRAAAETPIEEVTNALYGKSMKFAMTHDIEVKLPEMLFDGATFRISPRSFEGNGMIAKLEFIPKHEAEARLAGKIIKKKIQKFFKNKVLLSFLALLLIIKIIKIKLFWLLPLIIGVGAAKKLLLKFLLFLFPALAHLFKLCSYYQQSHHSTKFHHHHHLINHHHTIVPPWHSAEHPGPELIYTHPPKGHPSTYLHGAPIHETYGPPHSHEHFEGGWENSGPGLGSEFISDIHRGAQIEEGSSLFKPQRNDVNEIHAWGLGTTQPGIRPPLQPQSQQQQNRQRFPGTQQPRPPTTHLQKQSPPQQQYQKPHASSHSFNPFQNPDKPSIFTTKLKAQVAGPSHAFPGPVYTPSRNGPPSPANTAGVGLTAAQIAAQYDPGRNGATHQQQAQQQHQISPELAAQLKEAIRIQTEQRLVSQQQKILENQPFVQDGQPIMPKNYDPFYSPILLKIDKIVEQLGVTDELCKERLVCSMYKDPTRYSPHSNFVSAELSRDTNELQPVTNPNEAVLRFYRLIQAARDGQEQKDCLALYPNCNINTE